MTELKVRLVEIVDQRLHALRLGHRVFTSLEGENPGGSIKDHMTRGELEALLREGRLHRGDAISEISAGSTALSLAYHARDLGLEPVVFVPNSLPENAMKFLESCEARIHALDPNGAFEIYDSFTKENRIRRFDQMKNHLLRRHYRKAGEAIARETGASLVIGTVGTGHSLLGLAEGFSAGTSIVSAEPAQPRPLSGIRNLRLESMGENDPCDPSKLLRVEVPNEALFPNSVIETNEGLIEVSESFRVLLGGLELHLPSHREPKTVFAIGAKNKKQTIRRSA